MSPEVFARIIENLGSFSSPSDIFFGGLGEPLSHLNVVDMVRQAKSLGSSVELITNATLLNRPLAGEKVRIPAKLATIRSEAMLGCFNI